MPSLTSVGIQIGSGLTAESGSVGSVAKSSAVFSSLCQATRLLLSSKISLIFSSVQDFLASSSVLFSSAKSSSSLVVDGSIR